MQPLTIASVEPTVFFIRAGDALRQRVRLTLMSGAAVTGALLTVRAGSVDERHALPRLGVGTNVFDIDLPDWRAPVPVTLGLLTEGVQRDEMTIDWRPTRHWEVHLMHYSHHDLGYTDLPADVWREHAAILDDVLRYCDETADWPDDAQFRFVAEQAWSLVSFVENRPAEAVERLARAIRRGQIEVTALFANEVTELCGTEELIRLLYPAFALKRRFGIDIAAAEHNDIPGFSWGLANVLAGAGVRYFSPGVPRWYHRQVHQLWDEEAVLSLRQPGAFWWQAIDGSRVLVWLKAHGPDEWLPTSYESALRDLPVRLGEFEQQGYAYDMVSFMLRGGWRDNAPAVPTYATLTRRWNECWAYPHLVNSTYSRFLAGFETRWGGALKTLRGEAPGTDYPFAATCTPRETAVNRQAHDGLLSAEKWATLAAQAVGYAYPRAVLDEAYRNTLCADEHCWGMANPGGPAQDASASEKGGFAYRAAALAHDVGLKATNRMADAIAYTEDAYYLTVFNPQSWARTDVVRAPLYPWSPRGMPMFWQAPTDASSGPIQLSADAVGRAMVRPPATLLEQPFKLIDETTGESVVYQLDRVSDPQAARPWAAERAAMGRVDARYQTELVFVASALPPVGYKTYRIVPCSAWPDFDSAARATSRVVDNQFFCMELDAQAGAVAALFDKRLGHDLVDHEAPHGFAQVIARHCETGVQEPLVFRPSEAERLQGLPPLSVVESGPVFTTLRQKGSVAGCPSITREITLYHTLKRIDVSLRLLRDSTPNLELYCAFPFQVESPRFRYESAGAIIEPLRDQLPGSNTDYYGVQHWVEVSNDQHGVVWSSVDAPMAEFGGLWPGYLSSAHHGVASPGYGHPFLKAGELTRGHIYSVLMVHNYRTNFINAHAGEALFRYAFAPRVGPRLDGQAHAFGWGAADPPLAIWMKGPQQGTLPATVSFCEIDAPNVMLLAWKQAEVGEGLILRLIETEGRESDVTLSLPRHTILQASQTDLVEVDQAPLPSTRHSIRMRLGPYAIGTVRVVTER
jgi:hypothetical protein